MKTFIKLWKLQLKDRLPVLQQDLEEAVYLPPRLAHSIYNALILLYWTAIAGGSIFWLVCRYTYSLGVSTRQVLAPQKPLQLEPQKPSIPLPQPSPQLEVKKQSLTPLVTPPKATLPPTVEKISVTQLTTTAAQRVKAANPNMIVLARPWGKGWRIEILEPEKVTSIEHPWKLVVRS